MFRVNDPACMPRTGETPDVRLERSLALAGTPGEDYVEKRGIPVQIAHDAEVRFDPDWNGRAAVIVAMREATGELRSVHGRYLTQSGEQNKMLTIGCSGGAISVRGGWRHEPVILVEGLFDALSLAACGFGAVATVGRWAPWLTEICTGRVVWLAFDGNQPGDAEAERYRRSLTGPDVRRLRPPGQSKDWNTALLKQGQPTVENWLRRNVGEAPQLRV